MLELHEFNALGIEIELTQHMEYFFLNSWQTCLDREFEEIECVYNMIVTFTQTCQNDIGSMSGVRIGLDWPVELEIGQSRRFDLRYGFKIIVLNALQKNIKYSSQHCSVQNINLPVIALDSIDAANIPL